MSASDWQPSASIDILKARAALLQRVRAFFIARGVLEVDTPLLGTCAGTDVQLAPIPVALDTGTGTHTVSAWLQTSPEFAMKRLLAAGSGPIWQICKAFRNGDTGRRHNPEFLLLEWYQPGYALEELMAEVLALVAECMPLPEAQTLTYRQAFVQALDLDPFTTPLPVLRERAHTLTGLDAEDTDRDFWLDLLYSHSVEASLPEVCLLTEYPASQAALARCVTDGHGSEVALRFELIVRGVELANGYHELADAAEQRRRFEADREKRRALKLPDITMDERFLAALEEGLPDCCGVALGLDRLFMLALGRDTLAEVTGFDIGRV